MGEYRVEAIKTSYTDAAEPNTNFGQNQYMYTQPFESNQLFHKYAYIGFATPPFEEGLEVIDKLSIYLYAKSAPETEANIVYGGIIGGWAEDSITYNHGPSYAASYYTSTATITQPGWYNLDYTARSDINAFNYNDGVQIRSVSEAANQGLSATQYYSRHAEEQYRPYLMVTTRNGIPRAKITAPANTVVTANEELKFEWEYSNEAPLAIQKTYEIQVSPDGQEWITIQTAETEASFAYINPGVLTSDIKYWRVKVNSIKDVQSEWSEPALINVVAAPVVNIVSITNTPRPTIAWTAAGQKGFQVQIGNHDSGKKYGANGLYQCPEYIPDGPVKIRVRAVSIFGLWSDWAEQTIDITNIPGEPISLTATATHYARLEWMGANDEYEVLRDGKKIAKVTAQIYFDDFANGEHNYQVRQILDDGNYTLSNSVTIKIQCKAPMITDVENIKWIRLNKKTTALPVVFVSNIEEIYFTHYSGRKYPEAETSGYRVRILRFSTAYSKSDDSKELEKLVGKKVCYKDPEGLFIIGLLTGLENTSGRMYTEYTGTIQATEPEE